MKSMTGFAQAEKETPSFALSLDIKGYNGRFLDINVSLPPRAAFAEPLVRERVQAVCKRGKVEVFIRIREKNAARKVTVNREAALAYIAAARALRRWERLPLPALFALEGVLETESPDLTGPEFEAALSPLLDEALERFDRQRRREGEAAAAAIAAHLAALNSETARIEARAGETGELIKKNIRARFDELMAGEADEQRLLSETAFLLVKWTIAEELARLSAHLAAFDAERHGESPAKTLEFLCQEIQREINTIGSKSPQIEVSRSVVKCKEALENIREQLRNIE